MPRDLILRDVTEHDLAVFFEHQRDPAASRMAAFTSEDPTDREAFMARWSGILVDDTITKRTIVHEGRVVGSIASFERSGDREVTYWIGREFWGRGFATRALATFLDLERARPLHARAARDNVGSIRVLEKCGFTVTRHERGFANARGEEIDEVVLKLERP